VPGEIIHATLSVTPKGATALPIQFSWTLSLALAFAGAPTASAITTMPETDLYLQVPQGLGTGDLLIVATESSTGTFQYQTVHIGTASSGLSAEIGGVPIYAVVLGLLFLLLLFAVLGLWGRTGGGSIFGPGGGRAPAGTCPVHAPTATTNGAASSLRIPRERTPEDALEIHEAAATGNARRLKTILGQSRRRVNAANPEGFTPLGLAGFFGHLDAAKVLLDNGADVNATSPSRFANTALDAAVAGNRTDVVKVLLAAHGNPNVRSEGNATPLHKAT